MVVVTEGSTGGPTLPSRETVVPSGSVTGVISCSQKPFSRLSVARCWLQAPGSGKHRIPPFRLLVSLIRGAFWRTLGIVLLSAILVAIVALIQNKLTTSKEVEA